MGGVNHCSLHCRMGGVNRCSLHCRLAKFRGLMYIKYGDVIGPKAHVSVCTQYKYTGYGLF